MGLEVVWTRSFQPVLGNLVYSFSALLFTYLFATWAGSWLYRRDAARRTVASIAQLLATLAITSLVPVCLNDPRVNHSAIPPLLSIFPLCAALGYLMPKVIDRYSAGDPAAAGRAYALNTVGCILGPVVASYLLLPMAGARWSMILLATPFVAAGLALGCTRRLSPAGRLATILLTGSLAASATTVSSSYEEYAAAAGAVVRRDHTATVISTGEGMNRKLQVNGVGMTHMTPITKVMAHLPLAHLRHQPQSALVICFGMGTTFRSALTWDIRVTAVELVPSVKDAFGYYFSDAAEIVADPRARIVVDDGRRFLRRTQEIYDVVTIDPPPPVAAAGSSLLYSREFYALVKQHLATGGVLQQWFPSNIPQTSAAVAHSLNGS